MVREMEQAWNASSVVWESVFVDALGWLQLRCYKAAHTIVLSFRAILCKTRADAVGLARSRR
jgi:hypothetical protein